MTKQAVPFPARAMPSTRWWLTLVPTPTLNTRLLAPGAPTRSRTYRGSYLSLIDPCITQIRAQGPFMTCNESKEEEEKKHLLNVWWMEHLAAKTEKDELHARQLLCNW